MLEKDGYFVIKTAVSDANPDIIAFKNGEVYLIEVKSIASIHRRNYKLRDNLIDQMQKYCKIAESFEQQNLPCHVGIIIWNDSQRQKTYTFEIVKPDTCTREWVDTIVSTAYSDATTRLKEKADIT